MPKPETSAHPLLAVEGLSSGYGSVNILTRVSLGIERAEIVGVLGRNGAGKTTLLKTIMGIVPTTSGRVALDGAPISDRTRSHTVALKGIGYVPQGRAIFPALTVLDNLRVSQYAQGKSDAQVEATIEQFPVQKPHLQRLGGGLSGGQQQILALARALVGVPKVLLLDEPSEGIQPSVLDTIIDVLRDIVQKSSLAILLVEQNLDFAAALASRAYLLDMGQIVQSIDEKQMKQSSELAQILMNAGHADGRSGVAAVSP